MTTRTNPATRERALQALTAAGIQPQEAQRILDVLVRQDIQLVDEAADELATRWINVQQRPVPPEADTIIRTITNTVGNNTWSNTYWLEGLRAPRSSQLR